MAHKKEIRRGRVLIILELVIIEVLDHGTDGISLERFAVLTPYYHNVMVSDSESVIS